MYGEHYPGRYANGSIAQGPYLEENFSKDNPFKSHNPDECGLSSQLSISSSSLNTSMVSNDSHQSRQGSLRILRLAQ